MQTDAKCSGCGQRIRWIKTVAGKMMPCNVSLVVIDGMTDTVKKKLTIVTDNGVVISNPHAGLAGYVPHWATCPKANTFRKKSSTEVKV